MSFDWQDLVALTVVFTAALYMARRVWQQFAARRPPSGCGGCASCPREHAAKGQLVVLTPDNDLRSREPAM